MRAEGSLLGDGAQVAVSQERRASLGLRTRTGGFMVLSETGQLCQIVIDKDDVFNGEKGQETLKCTNCVLSLITQLIDML